MSTFREFAKTCRSNLKLTPDDKEPLELIDVVATTRTITKEFKLDGRIFEDTKGSRAFLDFEAKQLEELEILNGRVPPKMVEVSFKGGIII
jgi:hypothetical protein